MVKVEKEIIKIVPADPQVIYVPQYNPTTVVVYSAAPVYGYYPTPYPSYYYPYPPGAALATGVIWGAAIGAAWSGGRYGHCGGDDNINVNRNTNINTGNINRGGGASSSRRRQLGVEVQQAAGPGQQFRRQDRDVGACGRCAWWRGGGRWRRGARVGAAGGWRMARRRGRPAGRARSARRRATAPAAAAGRGGAAGGDAFGGYGSGRQTQVDSSRGASSRSSMSSAGAAASSAVALASRSAAAAVRARGGGGGARRRWRRGAAAAAVAEGRSTLMRTFPSIESKASP